MASQTTNPLCILLLLFFFNRHDATNYKPSVYCSFFSFFSAGAFGGGPDFGNEDATLQSYFRTMLRSKNTRQAQKCDFGVCDCESRTDYRV